MRLRRLDLTRYGKFTDHVIDFGDATAGRPDLHIVYGPNEAGKSTALSAFLDLLFGIETRSGYNFLHPYPTMRIGAALDLGGALQDVIRIKRPQNSLLNAQDQPVAEAAIMADLGGIDRDAYRTMFSLDDETLEAGGESILASKGDLGQLLFSATAGLADLSRGLGDLKAEAERFYKYRARHGELPDLKARLADLKAQRDRIDTLAADHARLVEARDRAAGHYDGTIASRGLLQARMEEIRRHLAALPRLAALRRIKERLAPLDDLPDAPLGWARALPGLQREEIELAVGEQSLAAEIDDLNASLGAIVLDHEALRQADRLEALTDLRARNTTADKDLPDRRQRLRDAEATIAGLLRRIEREGETEPARLVLGASVTGRLRDLIETRSGIEAALKSATGELLDARRRWEEAQAALATARDEAGIAPGDGAALAVLGSAIAAARSQDHAARRRLADRAAGAAGALLDDRLRELQPWHGGADSLLDLPVPDAETLAGWKARVAEIRKTLDRHAGEAERLTTERRRFEAERDAIAAVTGLSSDQDAAAVRARREAAWATHRQSLDGASADAFEAVLRQDDAVVAGRFVHVADLARLHQAAQALAVAEADRARAVELAEAAAAALKAVKDDVAWVAAAASPALASLDLASFDAWLTRRDAALRQRDLVRAAERDAHEAEADAATARRILATALAGAGIEPAADAPFDRLLALAEATVDRDRDLRRLRSAAEERRREAETRERDHDTARGEAARWTAAWSEVCAACWLGESGTAPPLATVRDILPALGDLASALRDRAGLADRVAKMEKDQAEFRAAITAVAVTLDHDVFGSNRSKDIVIDSHEIEHDMVRKPVPTFRHRALGLETAGPTRDLARALDERIRKARSEAERHKAEARKLDDAGTRRRALAATLDVHRRRIAEMNAFFDVDTLAEVAAKLGAAETRQDLRRQADEAERDVLDALRLPTLEEAEQALDLADRTVLETELDELKTRFDDLDQRCRDLFLEQARTSDALAAIGGDSGVADIEERRRTTLLEIEEGAWRYLKLRAGTAAAEQALRAYRDRHRGSMMARASDAFRTISRGAYLGLATQPEKEGETLIALPAGGGSKQAGELSKGTRFQLYLALRVAGYHEFARLRRPVPFIADDIMETFDDFRAEEAFRLFGDMAGVGQVIYLTHHRHLCEIARTVCPDVRIHEISAPAS